MRAWWLGVGLSLLVTAPLEAATRVTIQDLKNLPERYYGQTLQLECYYDKESPIWVRALPDADEWLGLFVVGNPEKAFSWSGEYYNLVFAPYAMRDAVRSLRGGDKITLVGEGFHYRSESFDGVGIHVQRILNGWGASAKVVGDVTPASSELSAVEPSHATPPRGSSVAAPAQNAAAPAGRYTVMMNGKRYGGLRFGDRYTFDGIDFQVDQQP